jgi:hypothetical protein
VTIIHGCGPSRGPCECRCTPEKRDCDHVWDGETETIEYDTGAVSQSVTCSKCGMSAMTHDMWCGP